MLRNPTRNVARKVRNADPCSTPLRLIYKHSTLLVNQAQANLRHLGHLPNKDTWQE